ncbi:glycosyltransferase family 2 protein [Falsirhodobacter sp. 20TX0035]|uniref:glycosyltransferase family 2 protein n=1 Tax=Falsirhodobacter sp. 20TX0035 TaxID=3022019 RepID=UPI00232E1363|nr:glycosyltransferase [Falsirhodobacter sp. 20TX0035]MDB6454806.1 glycosyltransferase [Falsirhodobacter sp. 20TX0035]
MEAPLVSETPPLVSVIMANFRGARWLEASMRSVLSQSHAKLELIVADDASDDDSVAIAKAVSAGDERVRVLPSSENGGPAATRNRALDAARGEWIAIVDSDDLIHPDRLQRLLAVARDTGADLVADDLVHFGANERRTLLQPLHLTRPMPLDAAQFMRSNGAEPGLPSYGYLKPLISRRALGGRRYDTSLHIGEDFDLVMRMLIDGASFVVVPDPLYAYRRHASSISHRMTAERMASMLAAHRSLPAMPDAASARAAAGVERHLERALRFERLVLDIKARRLRQVLPRLAEPAMLARLADSLRDRRRRKTAVIRPAAQAVDCPPLPQAGHAWAHPPAGAAALIGAGAAVAADLPDWGQWLDAAVRS